MKATCPILLEIFHGTVWTLFVVNLHSANYIDCINDESRSKFKDWFREYRFTAMAFALTWDDISNMS